MYNYDPNLTANKEEIFVVSVMLYPCILNVALLVYLFVLCVACLTVFVNCLVKQFALCCLGVVAILLLNVMEVFSVGVGALLYRRVLFELPCGGTVRKRSVTTPTQIIAIFIWTYYTSTFTNLLHAL